MLLQIEDVEWQRRTCMAYITVTHTRGMSSVLPTRWPRMGSQEGVGITSPLIHALLPPEAVCSCSCVCVEPSWVISPAASYPDQKLPEAPTLAFLDLNYNT
jgi:hypothetical protein